MRFVQVGQAGETLHRTPEKKKTVNPVWSDQSNLYIENPHTPLCFEVCARSTALHCSDARTALYRCSTETWWAPMTSWAGPSST